MVVRRWGWASKGFPRRLLTFALEGKAALPPASARSFAMPLAAPDLRASPVPLSAPGFAAIVRDGALVSRGMPQFAELSDAQLDSLRHYLRAKAREALGGESAR